jgi:hypothetical protein
MLRPYDDQIGTFDTFDATDADREPCDVEAEDIRELTEQEAAQAASDALARVAARIGQREDDDA